MPAAHLCRCGAQLASARRAVLALVALLLLAAPISAGLAGSEMTPEQMASEEAAVAAAKAWDPESGDPPPFLNVECMLPRFDAPERIRARRLRAGAQYWNDVFWFDVPNKGDAGTTMTFHLSLPDGTSLGPDDCIWIPLMARSGEWAEPRMDDAGPVVQFHRGGSVIDHVFIYGGEEYWCRTMQIRQSLSLLGVAYMTPKGPVLERVTETPSSEVGRILQNARQALRKRDYEKAHEGFAFVARETGDPIQVNNAVWCWAYGMGNSDMASGADLALALRHVESQDDRGTLLDTRAWWNIRRGSMARARHDAEQAVALQPWKRDVLRTLAVVDLWSTTRRTAGDPDTQEALRACLQAILAEPDKYDGYERAAVALLASGRPAEARRMAVCARHYIPARDPALKENLALVAASYRAQGRPVLAAIAGMEVDPEECTEWPTRPTDVPAEWPLDARRP